MLTSDWNLGDLIGFFLGCAFGLWAIWTGWQRFTSGTMPDTGPEFWRLRTYVNFINYLLLQPRQEQLTERQIQIAGLFYMAAGGFCVGLLALWALGIV